MKITPRINNRQSDTTSLSQQHNRLKAYLLYYSTLGKYLHNLQKESSIRSSEQAIFLKNNQLIKNVLNDDSKE